MPQNGNAKQTLTKNKIQNPNCWGGWREGDHCVLLLEIQLGTTITTWSPLLSKSTAGLVDRLTRPLFRECTQRNRNLYLLQLSAAPCSLLGLPQYLRCGKNVSVDVHMDKICNIFTMECYSDFKKNSILLFATIEMSLEEVRLK